MEPNPRIQVDFKIHYPIEKPKDVLPKGLIELSTATSLRMVKKGNKNTDDYWSTEFEKDLEILGGHDVSEESKKNDERQKKPSASEKKLKRMQIPLDERHSGENDENGITDDAPLSDGFRRANISLLNLPQDQEGESETNNDEDSSSPADLDQAKNLSKKTKSNTKKDASKKAERLESIDEFEELEKLGLLEPNRRVPNSDKKKPPKLTSEKPKAKSSDNQISAKDQKESQGIIESKSLKEHEDTGKPKKNKQADLQKSDISVQATPSKTTGSANKASKKPTAMIAAIKEAISRQKAEEERIKQEEEAKRREEEEVQRHEEELQRQKDEERQRKKEKEKERKERLKKEGKLISKADKEKLARNAEFLDSLKLQNLRIEASTVNTGELKKKIVYEDRKKRKPKETLTSQTSVIDVPNAEPPVEETKNDVDSSVAPDNWEESDTFPSISSNMIRSKTCDSSTNYRDEEEIAWTARSSNNCVHTLVSPTQKHLGSSFEDPNEFSTKKLVTSESQTSVNQTRPTLHMPVETPYEIILEQSAAENDLDYDERHERKGGNQRTNEHNLKFPKTLDSPINPPNRTEILQDDDRNYHDHTSTKERELIRKKDEAKARKEQRHRDALANQSKHNLRSPICCVLGHVDTGKTKLLDKIRQTNVQEGEAGGITQQIGATYFPSEIIREKIECLHDNLEIKIPGLLIIDTPGHESFANLRTRGSSLCNIAILVVDIMHGLEPQTIESLNLLRLKKTPFIVALNKIDRCYDWRSSPNGSFVDNYENQPTHVKKEFEDRLRFVVTSFAEQGLNAELYTRNSDMRRVVSLVPTSAITGEGIPDLLKLLIDLTQRMMSDKLMYLAELECTVLEVKVIPGLGTTIDVILSNGVLREGDTILLCGLNGPILTTIRALLTPQPCRELRIKSAYVHHKEVRASLGVKISGQDLDKAIAGSRLVRVESDDDIEELKEEVMGDLTDLLSKVDKSGTGVSVQASTLGSLEALLEFLKTSKIPVCAINIGPVFKKDVMRAGVMLEHAREFASILAFDVKIEKEAEDLAQELGVRIFRADIIYHLFDQFTAYMKDVQEKKKADLAPQAVFPCILRIVPNCVFNKRDPIILGVDVFEGILKIGTPLCIPTKDFISLGKVSSIEINHKPVTIARKGQQVAIKIECPVYENPRMFGRHFDQKDDIVSKISRQSIDILKDNFRNDLAKEDWALIVKLKSVFSII